MYNCITLIACEMTVIIHVPISHLHRAAFQDGDPGTIHIDMDSLHVGDGRLVKTIFIVDMDLKVWQRCVIARFRHDVAAVAHEVVTTFVKRSIVGITGCYACGCICRNDRGNTLDISNIVTDVFSLV